MFSIKYQTITSWKSTLLRKTFNISIFGYLLGAFNVPCQDWCQDQFWPQWLERDPFTAVFREKFRSQGTWSRVTGTNLDKTLDTQQTDKIRHRTNFVSVSVWPIRGSDIDWMTNKRMGGRLKPLSLGSCLPKSHQIKSPRWGKKDWPRPESH